MSVDTTKVELGVCTVDYKGVDLGASKGGVTLSYSQEYYEITADQTGNTVLDEFLVGESVEVEVPMLESDFSKLNSVIPGSNHVSGAGKEKLTIGGDIFKQMSSLAGALILHPIVKGDLSGDVKVVKAVPHPEISQTFSNDGERIWNVRFKGLLDTSAPTGEQLLILGDPSATQV